MIFLAFLNGVLIGLSRVINSRLGTFVGALGSSLYNHIVGLVFLAILGLFLTGIHQWHKLSQIPWYYSLGGVMGACFVTLSSFLIPKIGAYRSIILIIAGQMVGSVLMDYFLEPNKDLMKSLIGCALIILGISVRKFQVKALKI